MREIDDNIERCPHCGFSKEDPVPPHLLRPKTVLNNRYVVGRSLKLDGEGVTYISYDVKTNEPVTIREYLPLSLVSREAEMVTVNVGCDAKYKALKSDFIDLYTHLADLKVLTNIRRVDEVFEQYNTVYAVCEYLEYTTLNQFLIENAGELTWEQASGLFKPLLESLIVINSSGVLHRGISPDTIVVTKDGKLKLIGFSICSAKAMGSEIQTNLSDGYAAPEQYSRMTPHGEWTDVYAVCAVIYKVLTGTMPPSASTRGVNDNLIDLSELNSRVPKYVSRAVMRGLVFEYGERIQNIRELINTLYFATKMDQTAVFSTGSVTGSLSQVPQGSSNKPVRLLDEDEDGYVDEDYDDDYDDDDEYIEYRDKTGKKRRKKKSGGGKGKVSGKNGKKGKGKKKKMPIWVIVLLVCIPIIILICLFLYDMMIGFSPKNKHKNNSSETSMSSMQSSEPESLASSKPEPVSSAVPKTAMVELRGSVYNAAEIAKYKDTFNISTPKYEYNDLPAGQICAQSVEPGTEVTADEPITITVSKGPQMAVVPSYTGYSPADYANLLMVNFDIVSNTQKEYNELIQPGEIIRVDPGVGAQIDRAAGTQVTIFVSIGPDPSLTMPAQNTPEEQVPTA